MKKIIVFSDVHYATLKLDKMIHDNMDADYFFFTGDGLDQVLAAFPEEIRDRLYYVEGNCDTMYQSNLMVDVEDKKFFLTHGNKFGVKSGMLTIGMKGREVGADCVCFGHTHVAYNEVEYGIRYLNPGALTNGEYALVIVENGEIFVCPQRVLLD